MGNVSWFLKILLDTPIVRNNELALLELSKEISIDKYFINWVIVVFNWSNG